MISVGHRIRELRNERKWSQAKLAEESGISENYISEIENDARTGISLGMYEKIAEAFGISLLHLLLTNKNSEIMDSIMILLDNRPRDVQETALGFIELYLNSLDHQQLKEKN